MKILNQNDTIEIGIAPAPGAMGRALATHAWRVQSSHDLVRLRASVSGAWARRTAAGAAALPKISTALLNLSLILAVCVSVAGCATNKKSCATSECHKCDMAMLPPEPKEKLLKLTATVDGSGRIIFNGDTARYEHKFWTPPWNVTFDGEAWTDLSQTPTGWNTLSRQLDLPRAHIVSRTGRDVIALEPTPEGFDLYLNDTPNGADDYTVTIAIPRRE